jgi:hypothetical protein
MLSDKVFDGNELVFSHQEGGFADLATFQTLYVLRNLAQSLELKIVGLETLPKVKKIEVAIFFESVHRTFFIK